MRKRWAPTTTTTTTTNNNNNNNNNDNNDSNKPGWFAWRKKANKYKTKWLLQFQLWNKTTAAYLNVEVEGREGDAESHLRLSKYGGLLVQRLFSEIIKNLHAKDAKTLPSHIYDFQDISATFMCST